MTPEKDKEAIGWTDLRQFAAWARKAPWVLQAVARLYPPSIYRLKPSNGDVLRVFPDAYYLGDDGAPLMSVIALPGLNAHYPGLIQHRITGVEPGKLEPIKWPPDAEVH